MIPPNFRVPRFKKLRELILDIIYSREEIFFLGNLYRQGSVIPLITTPHSASEELSTDDAVLGMRFLIEVFEVDASDKFSETKTSMKVEVSPEILRTLLDKVNLDKKNTEK